MDDQHRHHDQPANLEPGEADVARRAVFAWTLLPAAARLTHEVTAGRHDHPAVGDLRAAVRLLDILGWPDDVHAPAELTAEDAMVVSQAARIQLTHGLDPDAHARRRVARGPADQLPELSGSLLRLLERLERAPG